MRCALVTGVQTCALPISPRAIWSGCAPRERARGLGQQRPDRIGHGGAMGVDLQVGRFVAVAGDVDVTDARRGQRTQRTDDARGGKERVSTSGSRWLLYL